MADGSTEVATVEQSPRANGLQAVRPVNDATAVFDSGKFEHMQRIARLMAIAPVVPTHLKGKSFEESMGNCFAIVEQAHRWGMSPFAVAQASYFVHGKPGYEGKLISAALQNMTGIKLRHEFKGPIGKAQREIVLWDPADPEREIRGTVEQWATKNEMWKTQPDDQLIYRGTRQWCRRYEPGVILGVYTPDELEDAIDVTPVVIAQPKGPPPAPKKAPPSPPKAAPKPIDDADAYLTQLEEEFIVAGDADTIGLVWATHLQLSDGQLPRSHQHQAEKLYETHAKRFGNTPAQTEMAMGG